MKAKVSEFFRRHRKLAKWIVLISFFYWGIPKIFRVITAKREYYPSGRLKSYREQVFFDFNFAGGRRTDGVSKGYYEDGSLKYRGYAVDGKADGVRTTWSPKGLKTDEWDFDLDKPRDGQRVILYDDGNTKAVKSYKNGLFHGRQAMWSQKGFLTDEWLYENGKPKDGARTEFFDSEKPRLKTTYANGVQEGWQTAWHENGALSDRQFFVKGRATIIMEYDLSGRLRQEKKYLSTGEIIKNYRNGQLVETLKFKN